MDVAKRRDLPPQDIVSGPSVPALSADDPAVRDAVLQMDSAGIDPQDISDVLGVPLGAVRPILQRSRTTAVARYDPAMVIRVLTDLLAIKGLQRLLVGTQSPVDWVAMQSAQAGVALKARQDAQRGGGVEVILTSDFLGDPSSDTAISGPVQHDIQHDDRPDQ